MAKIPMILLMKFILTIIILMNVHVNKIYRSEAVKFMAKLPSDFIDLTITSPPYDNLRDYKGYTFDFFNIAKNLFRITKQGGVLVWVVNDATIKGSKTLTSFKQAQYFVECGFNMHDTMLYAKYNPMPQNIRHKRYAQAFEYMFVLTKGYPKTFNPLTEPCKYYNKTNSVSTRQKDGSMSSTRFNRIKKYKIRGNIWYYNVGYMHSTKDKIAYQHPAIFPEKLAKDHIVSWSNERDLVFDPMCGSGTTIKQAKMNNRNYLGCEISSEYCKLARKRLNG